MNGKSAKREKTTSLLNLNDYLDESQIDALIADETDGEKPLVQFVIPRSMKPYLRSYTKNAREPSPAQMAHRMRFAEAGHATIGRKGQDRTREIGDRLRGVTEHDSLKRNTMRTPRWAEEIIEYWVDLIGRHGDGRHNYK